jgi:hypothetical protein
MGTDLAAKPEDRRQKSDETKNGKNVSPQRAQRNTEE